MVSAEEPFGIVTLGPSGVANGLLDPRATTVSTATVPVHRRPCRAREARVTTLGSKVSDATVGFTTARLPWTLCGRWWAVIVALAVGRAHVGGVGLDLEGGRGLAGGIVTLSGTGAFGLLEESAIRVSTATGTSMVTVPAVGRRP
jgi:hypothetical protein